MNEFNEQRNNIPERRFKSQNDIDFKLIRDQILNQDNNNNEIEEKIMKLKLKII